MMPRTRVFFLTFLCLLNLGHAQLVPLSQLPPAAVAQAQAASHQVVSSQAALVGSRYALDYSRQPMMGNADAPLALALFEDFLCPHCKTFHEQVLPAIMAEFVETGQARVYFFNLPITGAHATLAAIASECVYLHDATNAWRYNALVFANQGNTAIYTPQALSTLWQDMVKDEGLDPNRAAALSTCINERQSSLMVDSDYQLAFGMQLPGTPALLVDGQRVSSLDYATIARAIREVLPSIGRTP